MKNLEILFIAIATIVIVSILLYFLGVTYYMGATCQTCDMTYGIARYSFIPANIIKAVMFVPLYFYGLILPFTGWTSDQDINSTLALFLSFFSYFFIIYLVSAAILALISKLKSTTSNSNLSN